MDGHRKHLSWQEALFFSPPSRKNRVTPPSLFLTVGQGEVPGARPRVFFFLLLSVKESARAGFFRRDSVTGTKMISTDLPPGRCLFFFFFSPSQWVRTLQVPLPLFIFRLGVASPRGHVQRGTLAPPFPSPIPTKRRRLLLPRSYLGARTDIRLPDPTQGARIFFPPPTGDGPRRRESGPPKIEKPPPP